MARRSKRIAATPGYVMYLRTSDAEVQAPERSQDAQRRDIRLRLVNQCNLPFVEEYVDNFTGTSSDRKNYQRMLKDVRLGKVSHVFAAVPDRFGRDDVEALRTIDEMTTLGICVRFASHPDLDPRNEDDRLYLNILFGMAKRESAVIARRCKGGMLSKLTGGGWPWRAPDGYVNKEIKLTDLDGASPEEYLRHARYKRWIEKDPEQAKVWRDAWDLLLEDQLSLSQICEALAARGYRLRNGAPFVRRTSRGEIRHDVQKLSRVFNNWLYAGWVVVDNEWAKITPKTVRAEWEPIVTTEEFERGLGILARHRRTPVAQKKHFYLLQGLLYLEPWEGYFEKLRCSKPNANRKRGGLFYYCVPNCEVNFLCRTIDRQIDEHMHRIQIDPSLVPALRRAYSSNVKLYSRGLEREHEALTSALERLEKKEVNLWRAFTEHGMRSAVYEKLAHELAEERARIEFALKAVQQENKESIANLDAALAVISMIGERFAEQPVKRQREILLHMVERVIIGPGGKILRLELKPPFQYLQELANGGKSNLLDGDEKPRKKAALKAKRTSSQHAGSLSLALGDPLATRTNTVHLNIYIVLELHHLDIITRTSSVSTHRPSVRHVR